MGKKLWLFFAALSTSLGGIAFAKGAYKDWLKGVGDYKQSGTSEFTSDEGEERFGMWNYKSGGSWSYKGSGH